MNYLLSAAGFIKTEKALIISGYEIVVVEKDFIYPDDGCGVLVGA